MASLAHLKLFLELAAVVVPEVAPGALAVVVEGPGLEKALLEGPSQRWVVPVVAVALAEPTPSAGMQAALDPSPLPHCCWPETGRSSSVASEGDPSQSSDELLEGYLRLLGPPRTNRGLSASCCGYVVTPGSIQPVKLNHPGQPHRPQWSLAGAVLLASKSHAHE